jgi:Transposase DDE domain group 1
VVVAAESHSRFGFEFQGKITAAFDGGEITRDAGWLLVREFDDRLGLTAALRDAVRDASDRRYVSHDMLALRRQRVYQIAAGYEDANDATYLRHGPTLQTVAQRLGTPLASQPTRSRLIRVVGIDSWSPALVIARENVGMAGVSTRIELREQAVQEESARGC